MAAASKASIQSFAPIADHKSRVLILGSMPGNASLDAGQYYAHPRNGFWPIVAALTDVAADSHYAERTRGLLKAGIALWDVLACCSRNGSLDSEIDIATEVANDFSGFLAKHPTVTHVFFNGGKAEQSFARHVRPLLGARPLHMQRLPSTSPAHAGLPLAAKQAAWLAAIRPALQAGRIA